MSDQIMENMWDFLSTGRKSTMSEYEIPDIGISEFKIPDTNAADKKTADNSAVHAESEKKGEKRYERRLPIEMGLSISNLYKDGIDAIVDLESDIEITDISSKGIGFISRCVLPIGYFFIADLELSSDLPQIITDVRIVRSSAIDLDHYHYGAEFVSISPSVKAMLSKYENEYM